MSTEQLQHFQSLIQSNPELKQQLINYLAADRVLDIAPDIISYMIFAMFIVYLFSSNHRKVLSRILIIALVITVIAYLTAYLITPFIAPDIYLQLQTK